MPNVSIILPTFNRAQIITSSIRSVLQQTYTDFELIIVDDGSTDATEDCVKRFGDPRISYIRHAQNRGGNVARNTGISRAQGRYIAFQDSDDEWLPEKLERQVALLDQLSPDIGVVYTGAWIMKDGKKSYFPGQKYPQKEGDLHQALLKENFVSMIVTLVRVQALQQVGFFDESLPRLQDWDLWIRISKYYQFKFIDEPLAIIRPTPLSITNDLGAYAKANERFMEKYFQEYRQIGRGFLAERQYGLGSILCEIGDVNQGRKYMRRAIKTCPFHLPYYLAYLKRLL